MNSNKYYQLSESKDIDEKSEIDTAGEIPILLNVYIKYTHVIYCSLLLILISALTIIITLYPNVIFKSETNLMETVIVKPNIIIILADDLSWNSIGYSSDELAFVTPHLTDMANNGIIMDNFYAQEVCSPSRGSLLTGKYPFSIGMQYGMVGANAEWGMPLDETTIAEVLKSSGYATHMLGKWHLGYFTPLLLPTARGFDSWTGYANGENYYWSKKLPDYPEHTDFIESNKTCYRPYDNETDKHDYSTVFYTNKAVDVINTHSFDKPLFLYMSYQAVHDPFIDYGKHSNGMPDEYIEDDILKEIHSTIIGKTRQEYAKALYLLDKGVEQIKKTLETKGVDDNTYIIFMSDNGGCWHGGGKNAPLRGSKGALFEGGIKVDSFIYGSKLSNPSSVYTGLMHISDWFPTILALAHIEYTPSDGSKLDGVNQIDGWKGTSQPRTNMLYNMYLELEDFDYDIWTNGSFAVRDTKFKLMHTYDDKGYGAWYNTDQTLENDDVLDSDERCAQQFVTGNFEYWLFDLLNDPYETTNLYYSTNVLYTAAKQNLYKLLPEYQVNSKKKKSVKFSSLAEVVWKNNGNNVLPWADSENLVNTDKDFPILCA